jgi:hypothetical protein
LGSLERLLEPLRWLIWAVPRPSKTSCCRHYRAERCASNEDMAQGRKEAFHWRWLLAWDRLEGRRGGEAPSADLTGGRVPARQTCGVLVSSEIPNSTRCKMRGVIHAPVQYSRSISSYSRVGPGYHVPKVLLLKICML